MGKRERFLILAILLSILVIFIANTRAALLVLYKSSEGDSASQNIFAYHLQNFARFKGYKVLYHDIDTSFPSKESMRRVHAIVTVYHEPMMKNASAYIHWLSEQILSKKKVIILGNFGAFSPDGDQWYDSTVINPLFNLLGLDYRGNWTDDPRHITVDHKDPVLMDFETSLTPEMLTQYFTLKSLHPENQIFLSLSRNDLPNSSSAMIVKTPVGGVAMHYTFTQAEGKAKKLVNLNKFLDVCLQDPVPGGAVPEKKILAVYKATEHSAPEETFIARFLSKELIALGYWPEYHAIDRQGLPSADNMLPYRAVLTWFQTPYMDQAEEYITWLNDQLHEKRKVIILGNFGAFGTIYTEGGTETAWFLSHSEVNRFFYPFGLEFIDNWIGDPNQLEIRKKHSDMVEHEIGLKTEDLVNYFYWKSVYPENTIYLAVTRKDLPNAESAFIVRTPFGGFAFESYIYKIDPVTSELRFLLNRRQFLKECLEYQSNQNFITIHFPS